MVTIVNTVLHNRKIAKRVDRKSSQHKRKSSVTMVTGVN